MVSPVLMTVLSLALPASTSEETRRERRQALDEYAAFAAQFNRELADRYPFGPLTAEDAHPSTVCEFFRYHAHRLEPLRIRLDSLEDYVSEARFLKELGAAHTFLAATACSRFNQPIRITFTPSDTAPRSSNPPRQWVLTDDFGRARSPHGIPTLDWRFGSPIALEVRWSEQTGLRPRPARPEDDFTNPDSSSVRFAAGGKWALMRLIESRRTNRPYWWKERGARHKAEAKEDSLSVYLAFTVPLVSIASFSNSSPSKVPTPRALDVRDFESRTDLTVKLKFEALAVGKPRQFFVWPVAFPQAAPVPRYME